jgi:hypothetical protein
LEGVSAIIVRQVTLRRIDCLRFLWGILLRLFAVNRAEGLHSSIGGAGVVGDQSPVIVTVIFGRRMLQGQEQEVFRSCVINRAV